MEPNRLETQESQWPGLPEETRLDVLATKREAARVVWAPRQAPGAETTAQFHIHKEKLCKEGYRGNATDLTPGSMTDRVPGSHEKEVDVNFLSPCHSASTSDFQFALQP